MGNTKHVGRAATRMTVSIGVAVLVVMTPVAPVSTASSDPPPPDKTALIMGTSGVPTPDDFYVESVKNQFIALTHSGQDVEYVKVTTPEELWPSALPGRLLSLLGIGGSPEIFGPGGPAWDVPWWKLPGLFDLTLNQSVLQGVTDLERAMAAHGNDDLVIYGYSQSALIANREKRKLAEQYPKGSEAPDIDFVLGGDPNLPNGGFFARFPGLYIPIIDWSLNGPAPTDTQFDTVEINRQYDFMGDFPLYPLNLVADLNALLGFFYVHTYPFDVSLDPSTSTPFQKYIDGRTTYYFFETQDLPLFAPLRMLGVPESVIDVVEPFFREIVELGYDRSIPPWKPTPARLIPTLDPATVATDLLNAIGEGIDNAAALIGAPPLLSVPAPVTFAAPTTETAKADISRQVTATDSLTQTEQVTSTGVAVTNMGTADPASVTETPTETVTKTGQVTSTTKVMETAKANEASTGSRATPNTSDSAPMPKPAKPAGRPGTPRPVVRGSLGVSEELRDLPHRGNRRDQVATAGPSLSAASPSTGNNSAGGSSGDDAGVS